MTRTFFIYSSVCICMCACASEAARPAVHEVSSEQASNEQASSEQASSEHASNEQAPSDAPQSAAAIQSLLQAFHATDLPQSDALHAHPGAEESLIYLSEHGERLLVRARALASLRYFETDTAQRHLLLVLDDVDAHPKLIAAALNGCQGRQDASVSERAEALLLHADPRVRRAARQVAPSVAQPPLAP